MRRSDDPYIERPSRSAPLNALRLAGREAVAFARQAVLLHRDVTAVYPKGVSEGGDVVVLLHGLFATAGVLRPLRRHIEEQVSAHTASFTYVPGPGIERAALQLQEFVAELPSHARLHLVGHSMGGIVMRWFVQELGGDSRIAQTISLGSPFFGTRHARLMPSPCGRDILPESSLLARLRRGASHLSCAPHLSIVAGRDAVVTESTVLPFGEKLVVRDCGHNGLLFHPAVAREIVSRVRKLQPEQWARSVA
jgi:triacylglycerol lipase